MFTTGRRLNSKLPLFKKATSGEMDFRSESKLNSLFLLYGLIFLIITSFIVIALRLFQLTIVKGEYYSRLSEENRIREILIEPQRGSILDRKGFVMAENIMANVGKQEERLKSLRVYQSPEAIAHLVGYRQLADKVDLEKDSCLNKINLGDKIGKKGVEKLFDCDLRGKPGKKLIEVDARGKYLKTITVQPPIDGQTVQLAADFDLARKTYELIKGKKAAVIATKPQTGEVILFVSSLSFDSNDFEKANSQAIKSYFENAEKPMFNRISEATYPPGSIFKLVIAVGALEENKIKPDTQFEDTGIIKAGSLTFGNWYFLQYGKTDGMVNIVKAIQRSNDIFFYYAGEKLGVDDTKIWAERLGFGKATGIGLNESEGLVPSVFWKRENLKDNWYTGDTYNLSIGQGYLLVTPLQVNQATAVFADNGYLCRPQLLKNSKPECQKLPISKKTLDLIKEGMRQACAPGGTGWPLFEFKINSKLISTACKTGTAESQSKKSDPHAWFTVFAPFENPEIVLTVLVEEGGQGSDVAGPIARDILRAYFERNE